MIDRAHDPGVFAALDRFGAFYRELSAAAASVRDGSWLAAASAADPGDANYAAGARRLAQRVQDAVVRSSGVPGPRLPDGSAPVEMGYVLAALADEVFLLELDWPGRDWWNDLTLEERLYGTRIAGERLFELAELLIAENATGQDELVVALMQAFTLGFRGRFRGGHDRGEIRRLIRQLYGAAFHRPVPMTVDWRAAMPPVEALNGGKLVRVQSVRPWIYATIAAAAAFVVITHLYWLGAVDPVLTMADQTAALDRAAP